MLRPHPSRRTRSGFSLVDVCVAICVLAIALGTLVGSVFYAMRLEDVNAETAAATQLARAILEDMNTLDFGDVYAAYNATTADDPDPQHDYLAELQEQESLLEVGGKGGPTVSVLFPEDQYGKLREDVTNTALGMPRDLDGDGALDSADHSGDYVLLPVTLQLTWEGASGAHTLQMSTMLRAR